MPIVFALLKLRELTFVYINISANIFLRVLTIIYPFNMSDNCFRLFPPISNINGLKISINLDRPGRIVKNISHGMGV